VFALALARSTLTMSSTSASASAPASASASASPRFRSWPITATKSLEPYLQRMGLEIPADRIDGTSSDSKGDTLSDAMVSVGAAGRGGTGSFVSDRGLILTNWHVAYDAVRQASIAASSPENVIDYVKDGYVAKSTAEEIRGPNYEVWITRSCTDVSASVLKVIQGCEDPLERANLVRNAKQEIAKRAQDDYIVINGSKSKDGIRCDVQEMLPNESYVLFTFERLRDVRIVYVPPQSLGNFGGDTDNFEWPRHTADFTLLRAYVGPNGDAAEYSEENVPYKPTSFIKMQKDGVKEGEFVFLLGFPGSTMRYAPTSRLEYSDQVAVPGMIADFGRKLGWISRYETDSEEAAMKLGGSKKGLLNEFKRSKGKLLMMKKLKLMEERKTEEEELIKLDASGDASRTLSRLAAIYDELKGYDDLSSALEIWRGIYAGSALLAAGHAIHEYLAVEVHKTDDDREASYRDRNLPFLIKRLVKRLGDVHPPHEAALVGYAWDTLSRDGLLSVKDAIQSVFLDGNDNTDAAITQAILKAVTDSDLLTLTADTLTEKLSSPSQSSLLQDPFVQASSKLYTLYQTDRDRTKALLSERSALFATLLDLQRQHSKEEAFYPDCNGSLRISAGYVEGYNAADAVRHGPSTTLAGLLEKSTAAALGAVGEGVDPKHYTCPDRLHDRISDSTTVKNVPVNVLYSTDTVGGNSGSPVMNAKGEFVAINFDRQRQGLMNEFKWSADYSRSIGVDVRYILWLVGDYDGATDLVEEMLS